uniref:Uncharacterized protein n=1 Tax=Arundo donax TaxID=35708 RepID=A0A0A8YYD6_ARUDO
MTNSLLNLIKTRNRGDMEVHVAEKLNRW